MKTTAIFFILVIVSGLMFIGCSENPLEEQAHSELAPETVFTNRQGVEAVLVSAYGAQTIIGNRGNVVLHSMEWTTDLEWETGGGANRNASIFMEFAWDPGTNLLYGDMWQPQYRTIRNANLVLENIDNETLQNNVVEEIRNMLEAEAKFIRALSYTHLYNWFGPVPLRTSTTQELELPKASEDEIKSFIESELLESIPSLPEPGDEANYGRANKGSARAVLVKFYLNTKQWQKAADMAQDIINMGSYELYSEYEDLFKVANEQNSEFIFVDAANPNGPGNQFMNGAFPPNFHEHPRTGLTFQDNWRNWARQDRLLDSFYNSFDSNDLRRNLIISEYINSEGETVDLANEFEDNTRSFKFWPDPNAQSNDHGNDIPVIRYADILLARAEALNEINGPNQESIDLINDIRIRAGLTGTDEITLADFNTKEELRDHILQERGWEFYSERKRRQDLIRMDMFIEYAHERGITNADEHHRLFPIPQPAIDANPELEQNEGY